jgi:hypothetical protein
MGSKPPDLSPNNPVNTKRGRFDTSNSPTMVYVRRKIDHDQQNKPSFSSETPKNGGSESAKEPNVGTIEEKKEPDLECHEHNADEALSELNGVGANLVENKEIDPILNPKGDEIESQTDSELSTYKVRLADVTTEPKLDSELHELEFVTPIEATNGEKEPNSSPYEEKNEPDLVCHETNLDADFVELKVMVSNQFTSLGANEKEIEHHLDTGLQQHKVVVQNQVTNGDKYQNFGENEPILGSIRPKQVMPDGSNRSTERENCRERFAKLQVFLKDCDRSRQDDYLRSKNFCFQSSEFSLSRCPFRSCKLSLKATQAC